MNFVPDLTFNFSNLLLISFIFSSSCKKASWDTPSTRRSISNCGFFSKAGSRSRTSLLVLVTSSQTAAAVQIASQCDFWRWSWRNNVVDTICWHRIVYDDCMWLHLPGLQSLILCSGQLFHPKHDILISFPMTVAVPFLRNWVIIPRFFFAGISTKRVKCCEEDNQSSFVAFMYTRNQSILQDRLDAERLTAVKNYTFSNCKEVEKKHQLRVHWYSTRMSLNCSKVSQGIVGILTILDSCHAASFMNKSKPILFWEISCSMFCKRFEQYWPHRAPMHWGVRLSFIMNVMTHHSWTILETCINRALPYEELAGRTILILSFVRMVLCM